MASMLWVLLLLLLLLLVVVLLLALSLALSLVLLAIVEYGEYVVFVRRGQIARPGSEPGSLHGVLDYSL